MVVRGPAVFHHSNRSTLVLDRRDHIVVEPVEIWIAHVGCPPRSIDDLAAKPAKYIDIARSGFDRNPTSLVRVDPPVVSLWYPVSGPFTENRDRLADATIVDEFAQLPTRLLEPGAKAHHEWDIVLFDDVRIARPSSIVVASGFHRRSGDSILQRL